MGDLATLLSAAVPWADWARGRAAAADAVVVQGDFREEVFAPGSGVDPREFARLLGVAMAKGGLYSRAGSAWWHDGKAGVLQPMSPTRFPFWMLEHVRLMSETKQAGAAMAVLSADMAARVLQAPTFINALPEVARVSPVPLPVVRNGKVGLLSKGYSVGEKTMVLGDVDWREMSAKEGVELLRDVWLAEFPFDSRSEGARLRSLAVAVAGMLAPFCELLVPAFQQRPAFCFTANREGSGKTLLARLCLCPVFGQVKITPPPERGNENSLRQLLSSVARAGEPYLFFDNWRGKIGSPALEAFITANIWGDRVLGVSELFTAEKSCLVYMTGNDAVVSPDMRRRSLFVELFVEEVRSERRIIKRRVDEDDIVGARGEILSALWAIVRGWYEAGCPKGSVTHGSFSKWGAVVGAMVEWAVGASPLQDAELRRGDEDLAAFEQLVELVMPAGAGDLVEMTAADLLRVAYQVPAFDWQDAGDDDEKGQAEASRANRSRFGRICKRFVDSRFGEVRVEQTSDANRSRRKFRFTRAR